MIKFSVMENEGTAFNISLEDLEQLFDKCEFIDIEYDSEEERVQEMISRVIDEQGIEVLQPYSKGSVYYETRVQDVEKQN